MKFGKKIRTELSPGQLRGSVNYKALKQIAKKLRRAGADTVSGSGSGSSGTAAGAAGGLAGAGGVGGLTHQQQQQRAQGIQEFFAVLELEKEKVQHQSIKSHDTLFVSVFLLFPHHSTPIFRCMYRCTNFERFSFYGRVLRRSDYSGV